MKIGFIGIGKLGLPICVGMAHVGHDVLGYDINPTFCDLVARGAKACDLLFSKETTMDGYTDLKSSSLLLNSPCRFTTSLEEVVQHAELLFCAVQTPHDPQYEGISRLPKSRSDFNYNFLIQAVKQVVNTSRKLGKMTTLVIISTVLPGTIRRDILPHLDPAFIRLVYNPYFIAMGTVLYDFFHPEFTLIGVVDETAKDLLLQLYATVNSAPVFTTNLENAEMIKVSYNTFITAKICLTNAIMMMCDRLENTSCDEVMRALFLGTKRIISASYLQGGMGDGGGCHPRDNIAMSWLSDQVGLPTNFYDGLMQCREQQTEYLVSVIEDYHIQFPNLPIFLMGKSFKPETDLTIGSPAILLRNLCLEKGIAVEHWDPYVDEKTSPPIWTAAIYCLTTRHETWKSFVFPRGSVVIDPFRFWTKISPPPDIVYHAIGAISNYLKINQTPDKPQSITEVKQQETKQIEDPLSRTRKGCTFVTALYDIHRPDRSFDSYLPHFQKTLLLREPMVIFLDVSKNLRSFAKEIRDTTFQPTVIIETTLEDIPCYWMLSEITKCPLFTHHPTDVTFTCPLYCCVQYSKFKWAEMALQHIPNKYVCWIDAGISRFFPYMDKLHYLPEHDFVLHSAPGKWTLPEIGSCQCVVKGTIWFATKKGLDSLGIMDFVRNKMFLCGKYDNEQVALAHLVHQDPSKFSWIADEPGHHLRRDIFRQEHMSPSFEFPNAVDMRNFPEVTSLCNVMSWHGSDKGNGWHNFTMIYHRMFQDVRHQSLKIFELGLGTTSLHFPSSMGPNGRPLASHRGWREYFPNATIYGADIDPDIITQEEDRIHTFFVDQRDTASVHALWKHFQSEQFDIMIDDGLHEIEHNIHFLKNSIHKLTENGLYFIEDIKRKNVDALRRALQQMHLEFEILDLPGANVHDNILCVIWNNTLRLIPRNEYIHQLQQPYQLSRSPLTTNFNVGFFCMCSYQSHAWEKSLESLRSFYPDAPIVLVNDGFDQFDYKQMADKFHCIYLPKKEQLLLHFFNDAQVREFFNRVYECCQLTKTKWMVHWHADMICRGQIKYMPPGPLCGCGFNSKKIDGKANNSWDSFSQVTQFIRESQSYVELNGWGSAGGSVFHTNTYLRVFHLLASMDISAIRNKTWADIFKHDDTAIAIAFALCGYPYRIWRDNPDISEDQSDNGAFLHGYKQNYDYVLQGRTLSDHHKKCARENESSIVK